MNWKGKHWKSRNPGNGQGPSLTYSKLLMRGRFESSQFYVEGTVIFLYTFEATTSQHKATTNEQKSNIQ